jgi:hypothetical protein
VSTHYLNFVIGIQKSAYSGYLFSQQKFGNPIRDTIEVDIERDRITTVEYPTHLLADCNTGVPWGVPNEGNQPNFGVKSIQPDSVKVKPLYWNFTCRLILSTARSNREKT